MDFQSIKTQNKHSNFSLLKKIIIASSILQIVAHWSYYGKGVYNFFHEVSTCLRVIL